MTMFYHICTTPYHYSQTRPSGPRNAVTDHSHSPLPPRHQTCTQGGGGMPGMWTVGTKTYCFAGAGGSKKCIHFHYWFNKYKFLCSILPKS